MDWTSAQLRSLVELTRRGTVTAVAKALGYTPGGVSQQIAALEKATGTQLLRRVGRRVELTDAGATLANAEELASLGGDLAADRAAESPWRLRLPYEVRPEPCHLIRSPTSAALVRRPLAVRIFVSSPLLRRADRGGTHLAELMARALPGQS